MVVTYSCKLVDDKFLIIGFVGGNQLNMETLSESFIQKKIYIFRIIDLFILYLILFTVQ